MRDDKITQQEMIEMFGEEIPIEAVNLIWNAPDGTTCGEIRAELRRIAQQKKTALTLQERLRDCQEYEHQDRVWPLRLEAADALDAKDKEIADIVQDLEGYIRLAGEQAEEIERLKRELHQERHDHQISMDGREDLKEQTDE